MNPPDTRRRWLLTVGALGVVYGDIGTSPLYALRECFSGLHGIAPEPANVLGVLSLIIWSLVAVVSVKYLGFVMRADNKGEGGDLALLALVMPALGGARKRWMQAMVLTGILGAALLYGDGMITPAITVLGAVGGLEVATTAFKPYVVPISVGVLVALFSLQKHGTGRVGKVFGPIMLLWFSALAVLGVHGIAQGPRVLQAFSPHHAVGFLMSHTPVAFVVLGAVFLALTGAEALYADMGHFGAGAIRRAWFGLVFPCLVLNYLGQGALLLNNPAAASSPFYRLAPDWLLYWLVGLATVAAVIASQALIAGAYSITMQAIQMGFLPRLRVLHTSHSEKGQVYMPQVNAVLMVACVGLVLGFQSSGKLASAYGIAVSLAMIITTLLFLAAARHVWRWPAWKAGGLCAMFLVIELAFLGANSMKVSSGGWFPLIVGAAVFLLMTTWHSGKAIVGARLAEAYLPMEIFLEDLEAHPPRRVPGTAVFLAGRAGGAPIAMLHNLKHNRVLHERIVVLTVVTEDVPVVPKGERLKVERLREDVHRVTGRCGFMEQPNVPELLEECRGLGLAFDMAQTTFFLSRETVVPALKSNMPLWRRRLFAAMSRNAQPATAFFGLPANRVVELGMQVEI